MNEIRIKRKWWIIVQKIMQNEWNETKLQLIQNKYDEQI